MRILNGLEKVLRIDQSREKHEILFLVMYADHLDCFISCSTHAKTALVFGWMDKSGLTVRV